MSKPVANCPVCQSTQIESFMTVGDNGHLRRSDIRLPVHRCRSCDLFFLNPAPEAEVGREYFAHAYAPAAQPRSLYYDEEFKRRTSLLRLETIRRHRPAGRTLLDVGCGQGHFVAAASAQEWNAWGVELDPGACEYAARQFGLEHVLAGSMDHPDLPSDFDVITMWDVIEHVADPVSFLRQAADRLRHSGLLLVRTGNIRSWSFDKDRRRWWAFGSDHRFYFSPRSLESALAKAGFLVVEIINGEKHERPDKSRARDISETAVGAGVAALVASPAKITKLGRYSVNLARRITGPIRFGPHYRTSIMTVVARRVDSRPQ